MSDIYLMGLEANAANYAPLTPLVFLDWSADVYPGRTAVVHGARRFTWAQTRERCQRLASALSARGVGRGDTVSVVAANTPEMVEAHFGVPMTGAVLNTINTRLDAATIAYILDHAQARVLITDREFSPAVAAALRQCEARPLVIDIDDPEYAGPGDRLGEEDYEALLSGAAPRVRAGRAADEWQAISLNYTSGTTGSPKGVVYHHRGAHLNAVGNILTWGMPRHSVYLWTLPMFHCNGWCFPWTVAACAGTNVCLRKVDAAEVFAADAVGRRHALLRGTGRAQPADRRSRGAAPGHRPGVRHGGRCRAAGRHDRGHGAARVRPDPRLWADRDLRARRGVRQTRRTGTAWTSQQRAQRNGRQGVRYQLEDAMTVIGQKTAPGCPPTARPSARSSSAATSP